MVASRLSDIVGQLVKIAPVAEVGLAVLLAGSSLAADLPKAEFTQAIGNPVQFAGSVAVEGKTTADLYQDFGGSGDFVASLIGALIFNLPHLVITLMLVMFVGVCGLWLRACKHEPLKEELANRLSWVTALFLALFVGSVAMAVPKYTAPSHLDDIAVRLASYEDFRDQSRWLLVAKPDREYLAELYSWLHGVDPQTPAALDNRRAPPLAVHFRHVHDYYSQLAAYTIWFLLVLVAVMFLASSTVTTSSSTVTTSQQRLRRINRLSFLLLLASMIHLFQWFWLSADYGRVRVVANLLEVQANHFAGRSEPIIVEWPFSSPDALRKGDTLFVRNLWPLDDPSGTFGLAATATVVGVVGDNEVERDTTFFFTRTFGGYEQGQTRLTFGIPDIQDSLQLGDAEQLVSIKIHDGQGTASVETTGGL